MPRSHDDDARARILDAALRLHERHGQDFTLEQLQEDAAVSRSTLYRRFNTKGALLEALMAERAPAAPVDLRGAQERILDAVAELVGERGLASVSIEAVAQRAGVGSATVYRSFGDREQLMQAASGRLLRPSGALIPADCSSVEEGLQRFARRAIRLLRARPGLLDVFVATAPETRELLGRYLRHRRGIRRQLVEWLREQIALGSLPKSQDPEVLTAHLLGLIIAEARLLPDLSGQAEDADRAAARIVRLLLRDV